MKLSISISSKLTSITGPARTCEVKSKAKRRVKKAVKVRMVNCEDLIFSCKSVEFEVSDCREFEISDYRKSTAAELDYLTDSNVSTLHLLPFHDD